MPKSVKSENICNLSRLPIKMENNPLYKTCLEILNNNSIEYTDTSIYNFGKKYFKHKKSLGEIFGIEELQDYDYRVGFLPWIHEKPQLKIVDNAFIRFNIEEKFNKLKKLLLSIKDLGYVPKNFPDRKNGITGYTLQYKGKSRFYVVSGNHRAAALSALRLEIPFNYESGKLLKESEKIGVAIDISNYPSIFLADKVADWPSVRSGFIGEKVAIKIISKYFEE